jgi:hypothetical protein
MELRRRFIFRGNAAAIGGRIVRPTDVVIDSSTASSLTVLEAARDRRPPPPVRRVRQLRRGLDVGRRLFDDVKQQIN